jgi:hypothetical protein
VYRTICDPHFVAIEHVVIAFLLSPKMQADVGCVFVCAYFVCVLCIMRCALCVSVYVCVCVCVCLCVCACMYVCECVCVCVCFQVSVYVRARRRT